MKSSERLARELTEFTKNHRTWPGGSNYAVSWHSYRTGEAHRPFSDREIIDALCERLTEAELTRLKDPETRILIAGRKRIVVRNRRMGYEKELLRAEPEREF